MEQKERKPIPTTAGLLIAFMIAGILLVYFDEFISGILCLVLALMLGSLQLTFWITILFLQQPYSEKKSHVATRNIAKFYLQDRRLPYNKSTFEKAIKYQWLDVVTMCLELGIKDGLKREVREKIIDQVIDEDFEKVLQLLHQTQFVDDEKRVLLYALKQGSLKCFKFLVEQMQLGQDTHEINFKQLEMPISLGNRKHEIDDIQLLINIIRDCDEDTLELLKDYFNNQGEYALDVQEDVTGYVRLSAVEVTMEKYRVKAESLPVIRKESECQADLYRYIAKNYTFALPGQFVIEGIYKERPYLEGQKVPCEHCEGQGHILCSHCEGKKYLSCSHCEGEGKVTCSKCGGNRTLMCWDVKKYIECQSCHKGEFACPKCDEKGLAICPTCEGRGTRKCSCPKSKRVKCSHCQNGYVPLKNGMYKKCEHCKDGYMCSLCHSTGWVIDHQGKKEFLCSKCKGKKKITCSTCDGKKKLRCNKAHETVCQCQDGTEICEVCQGKKVVLCDHCHGHGYKGCQHCEDGYVFENTQVDFKGKQRILNEVLLKSKYSDKIGGILPEVKKYVINNHPFIKEVYTLQKVGMVAKDIQANESNYENQIRKMVINTSHNDALDILEVIPLKVTLVQCRPVKGEAFECILINDRFYKTNQL